MKHNKYPKYQFKYSKDDYNYNLKYKMKEPPHEQVNHTFFIETLSGQVQKLSKTMCQQINQAQANKEDRTYVRLTELGGHCIDLHQMQLINIMTGKRRKILDHLPPNTKIEPQPQLTIKTPSRQLTYSLFHWMELIGQKYHPLQLSFSDHIERCYQLYKDGYSHQTVIEFTWQQYRFILDLRNNTLQNCNTLEITHLQRRNLKEKPSEVINQEESIGGDTFWQFAYCDYGARGIEWMRYNSSNIKELEKYYKKYQKNPRKVNNFKIMRGTQKYYVDFIKMIEYDPIYKTSRKIRRVVQ